MFRQRPRLAAARLLQTLGAPARDWRCRGVGGVRRISRLRHLAETASRATGAGFLRAKRLSECGSCRPASPSTRSKKYRRVPDHGRNGGAGRETRSAFVGRTSSRAGSFQRGNPNRQRAKKLVPNSRASSNKIVCVSTRCALSPRTRWQTSR